MKKSLIAGAGVAAFAFAAMPLDGVFAVTEITDTLSVQVASSCELGSDNSGNTAGQAYTAENKNPGTLVTWSTQHTVLDINCNNTAGYKITPTFTGLTANSGADSINYSTSTVAAAGSGTWTAYYKLGTAGTKTAFPTTAITGTSTMTDYYTIDYEVGIGTDQAAGTYTGSAKYELAVNNS